jgi:hypothetical protein
MTTNAALDRQGRLCGSGRAPQAHTAESGWPWLARGENRRGHPLRRSAGQVAITSLLRSIDQNDVGVLTQTVEHDVFAVGGDVEPSQASLVRELRDLPPFAPDEIEQPEVQ